MSTRISSRGGRSAREFLNYLPTIIGLIVALSWPFWISPLLDLLFRTVAENPYLSHAGSWLAAGILLSIVLVWERQPMSSLMHFLHDTFALVMMHLLLARFLR